MAGEIQTINAQSGLTLYAIVRDATGQVYNGSSFTTYATAGIASYVISLTEQGTASRYYVGTFPVVSAGVYSVTIYKQAGGAPAETDKPVAHGFVFWNGTALQSLNTVSVVEFQAAAVADLFNTNSGTDYSSSVSGSVVKEIVDNAAGSTLTVGAIADAVWDELRSGHVVSGSFGEYVLADTVKVSGDATAADNLELMYDGTGYVGGTAKLQVEVVSISGDTAAADKLELFVEALDASTGQIDAGTFAANAIDANALAADAIAEINATVDTALIDIGLDHLFSASVVGADITDNSFAAKITSKSSTADFDSFDNTTDSLQALQEDGVAISGTVSANMVQISGDATAADNLEAALDGTGGVTITADLSGAVTSVTGGVTLATNAVSAAALAADAVAEINATMDTALADIGLDHLVSAAVVGADVANNSIVAQLAAKGATADWDSFNNTTDSLEALQSVGVVLSGTPDVNVAQISGDATAADRLEAMLDGTGGITISADLAGSVTSVTNGVTLATDAVNAAALAGDAIAEINATVDAALSDIKLDHLVAVAEADDPVDDSIMAKIASKTGDWSTFNSSTESLEALVDVGVGLTGTPDVNVAQISGDSAAADSLEAVLDGTGGTITATFTGNLSGNVTGSVGSISGITFPSNFGDLAITPSDGRVDVGEWLGTAVTLSATGGLPEVDATSISDSGAAADAVQSNIGNLDAAISSISIPSAGAIADQVWNEAQTGHTTPGSFGYYLDARVSQITTGLTAAAIADQVWNEARADHTTAGTFGEGVLVESLNTQAKADVNAEADTALTDYDALVPGDLPTNFASLAIDGSGRIDVGEWLGTAVTLSATGGLPEVDATSISDSGAAADAVQANIANLDAAITTRAPSATALSTSVWTSARAGYLDNLNVSGTLAHSDDAATYKADVSGLATAAALSTVDANIDTLITRVPDVVSLANINAQVDTALTDYDALVPGDLPSNFGLLSIDGSGHVLIAGSLNALDDLTIPTVAQIADGVWDEAAADHTTAGTTGAQINLVASGGGTATLGNQESILKIIQSRI